VVLAVDNIVTKSGDCLIMRPLMNYGTLCPWASWAWT